MVEAMFGSPGQEGQGWSLFLQAPARTYSTKQLCEVLPLLRNVDEAARSGAWVALMLSYEAAPAFDHALQTHSPGSFPLAWAAVFPAPSRKKNEYHSSKHYLSTWIPQVMRSKYLEAVAEVRELIARGDTYQVNYTFPMVSSFKGDPWAWYNHLCAAQGAAYCAYLDLGRYKILSLSPELFFERTGNLIKSKPMKGTIGRGRWAEEDEALANGLANSAKDRAENVMIVDLIRNDLGKVSVPGSVRAPTLFQVERFNTLWQMTSTVQATLGRNLGLAELMTALFPCGSITGAPKVRTMEIIHQLEPFPRHVYTGAIGFIRPGGDCIFNVAIRTLLLDSLTGNVTFGVGGGVTFDSIAESEYEECLLKSSFLESRLPAFRLLESILLESGGFFLLSRHLNRIRASANYFGFRFGEEKVLNELKSIARHHSCGRWKIRLLLSEDGEIETETLQLDGDNPGTLRVALAASPVDSLDRFLFHKTTNRSVYEKALAARPDCDDVILWNEQGEITESNVANIVLSVGGQWWTPPQDSGLLAGTFREELLAQGRIREHVISIDELREAPDFFLINSVHKWMRAVLVK